MLDVFADDIAQNVQDDLANDEEEDAERNVAQWPAVLQCANDEDDLADNVDEEEDGVHDVGDNEDSDRVLGVETSPVLEGEEGDSAANNEHAKRAESQQPDGKCCAILVQLESNEAIDQQTGAEGRNETVLSGGEVRIWSRPGCGNAGIKDERNDGQEHVDIEEGSDFFAS